MNSCVIMHMIIENVHANPVHDDLPYYWKRPLAQVDHEVPAEFKTFLQRHHEIHTLGTPQQFQGDVVTHLWVRRVNTT
jgi:hypothetical protein